jgi:hypothetical protein
MALISGLTLPSWTGPKLLKEDIASVEVTLATRILFLADLPLPEMVCQPPAQEV